MPIPNERFSLGKLREKAEAVMSTIPEQGYMERFTYLKRHFWVIKNYGHGIQITQCLCAKCVELGPIA